MLALANRLGLAVPVAMVGKFVTSPKMNNIKVVQFMLATVLSAGMANPSILPYVFQANAGYSSRQLVK